MKKLFYFPGLLFMAAVTLTSCRNENTEAEQIEEDVTTTVDETEDMTDNTFAQYDANRDNQWDENEFTESYQGEFSGYDADTSGDLNNEEFTGATFRSIDRDRNNTVNRQEWDEGYNNNFGDYANQEDFDTYDTDRSGDLSDTEWNEGFAESTWFGTFDEDQNSTISDQEWTRGNFSAWDNNNDGFLDEQEFQTYNNTVRGNEEMNSGNQNTTGTQNQDTNDRNTTGGNQ